MPKDSTPLVSIGIPCYNRPEGLKQTLEVILNQTYSNIEVIISDNASDDPDVPRIASYYSKRHTNVRYFRQSRNIGPCSNLEFVYSQCRGDFFLWATDDDYFESLDLVERLLKKHLSQDLLLVFPQFSEIDIRGRKKSNFLDVYTHCKNDWDYLRAWCINGSGQPVYGMFNVKKLRTLKLKSFFDKGLSCFNEGMFLHTLFAHGACRILPEVSIAYTRHSGNYSSATSAFKILKSLIKYTLQVHLFHLFGPFDFKKKMILTLLSCRRHFITFIVCLRNVIFGMVSGLVFHDKIKFREHLKNHSRKFPLLVKCYEFAGLVLGYADYLRSYTCFLKSKSARRFQMKWNERYPCLNEKNSTTSFDDHYIYHTAWAARKLRQLMPERHVDVSSLTSFSTMISAFIPTDFYDYRPVEIELDNYKCRHADITRLPFQDKSVKSLSCMHVVEHIGLGRYGDRIDYDGDLKAVAELNRVVAEQGILIFVVPIGKTSKIMFNAHRIYTHDQVLSFFPDFDLLEFSLIPDKLPEGIICNASKEQADKQEYGCGCFLLRKKAGTNV